MELFILRHLPTDYNHRGILQGRRDIPILPPDDAQQRLIGQNMEKLGNLTRFDQILASTLKRTRMTARCYGAAPTLDPLLDELDFGSYEGRRKEALLREQPLWTDRPDLLTLGEPLGNLEKRVRKFLATRESAKNILLFGHGAWLRALLSWVETRSIRKMNQYHIPNNELIRLTPAKEL